MAEIKKSEGSDNGMSRDKFVFALILLLFGFFAVGTILEDNKILNYIYNPDTRGEDTENLSTGFLYPNDLHLGDKVINKKEVSVRQVPAGQRIGRQEKLVIGRVIEGPVRQFGVDWWRIDYPQAPDGWVEVGSFSNRVFLFSLFNIVPLSFNFLRPVFIILSIILAMIIFFVYFKIFELKKLQKKKIETIRDQKEILNNLSEGGVSSEELFEEELPISNLPIGEKPTTEDVHDRRWANIQSLIQSYNSNDWKQAIIEADVILDEMLDRMGYSGESLGDKLKKIEPSDFITLNQAWEAHKFRNKIAHGNNLVLSRDEVQRVIGLYEEVFNEFFYI